LDFQNLHPVATPATEHEQIPAQRIYPDAVFGQRFQSVEHSPHIAR